jgi:hypothetical protein
MLLPIHSLSSIIKKFDDFYSDILAGKKIKLMQNIPSKELYKKFHFKNFIHKATTKCMLTLLSKEMGEDLQIVICGRGHGYYNPIVETIKPSSGNNPFSSIAYGITILPNGYAYLLNLGYCNKSTTIITTVDTEFPFDYSVTEGFMVFPLHLIKEIHFKINNSNSIMSINKNLFPENFSYQLGFNKQKHHELETFFSCVRKDTLKFITSVITPENYSDHFIKALTECVCILPEKPEPQQKPDTDMNSGVILSEKRTLYFDNKENTDVKRQKTSFSSSIDSKKVNVSHNQKGLLDASSLRTTEKLEKISLTNSQNTFVSSPSDNAGKSDEHEKLEIDNSEYRITALYSP